MTPFFSVVIPLYNKEKYIQATIESVLNQTFLDFEIIVVNDGSTDNSQIVLKSFENTKIKVYTIKNHGVSYARNYGIEKASAKYIALFDADDFWHENHLSELKKLINCFPDSGLYCNNYEIFYKKDIKRKTVFNFSYNDSCLLVKDFFTASIIDSVAWTSAVAFSKEKFMNIGGFDTNFINGQDTDLWIRFALKFPVCFNPKTTASYNKYIDESLSKNENNKLRYELVNKFKKEEKDNSSLKLFMDINRYSVALRSKIHNQSEIYNKLKGEIDYKNLNWKQKTLLNLPKNVLKFIKNTHEFLIAQNLYISSYS
jgi:glycosyltransferase involved in cell wall biosynthesis